MYEPAAPAFRAATTVAIAVLALAPPVVAQDPGRSIARSIDDLAEPSRARAAAAALIAADPIEVVPRLAALVVTPQRYVEPRQRVLGALFVLGRLGAAGEDALAALQNAAGDRDWGIGDQALWALAEVGRHADAATRQRLVEELGGDHLTAAICRQRLRLGVSTDFGELATLLQGEEPSAVMAACLQLRAEPRGALPTAAAAAMPAELQASPALGSAARERLLPLLHARLVEALEPVGLPWQAPPLRAAASALAAAWQQCAGPRAAPDALIGRGLLEHFEPELRRCGLDLIAPLRDAPLAQRSELLPLLFDADAELRQVAAWAFGSFGARGLPALPGLRRLSGIDGDVGVRMACSAVADDLLASFAGESAPLLAAIDERLCGRAAVPLRLPDDRAGLDMLVEVLCGAEWVEPDVVTALVPAPATGAAVPQALRLAVLRYAVNSDDRLRHFAAAWLARHGQGADGTLEQHLDRIAGFRGGGDPALVEMLAWVRAGHTATAVELQQALQHPSPRVIVRGAVELLSRRAAGGDITGDIEVARQLLEQNGDGDRLRWWQLGRDLAGEVRAAATMLLLAQGAGGVDRSPLRSLAPADVNLADWLQRERSLSEWAGLGLRLEERVQLALDVPAGIAP